MAERATKQVIVMRKDLGMRAGKMIAQGAHAALAALEDAEQAGDLTALNRWHVTGKTKICVRVESETELMRIFAEAAAAGLPVNYITDAGHTEFHGVPTRTCLAIGPHWSDEIDRITGDLKLL